MSDNSRPIVLTDTLFEDISEREADCLQMAALRMSSSEIGAKLGVSANAVNEIFRGLSKRTGVKGRFPLAEAYVASRAGLDPVVDPTAAGGSAMDILRVISRIDRSQLADILTTNQIEYGSRPISALLKCSAFAGSVLAFFVVEQFLLWSRA